MPDDQMQATKTQIPTNLRLLVLIEEVAKRGGPVTPAALSEALDLPRATIHRLLTTAESEGFLQKDLDGRSYGPGKRLRKMSTNTLSSQRIRTERLIVMKRLAEQVGETCNLAVPDRFRMVYLERVETHWPLRIQFPIGATVPFHCTASGKMYLASLRRDKLDRLLQGLEYEKFTDNTITDPDVLRKEVDLTQRRGYGTDEAEFIDGMAAIAVAIRDNEQRLLATSSIHAPIQRLSIQGLEKNLERLLKAAGQLERLVLD